jgi:hypothetical protein
MAILLSPTPRQRFVDSNGDPLAAGKVYTYYAGTLNPVVTYSNKDGTENTNPIVLDAAGKADIWLADNGNYKFVIKDADDVDVETIDDITYPTTGGGGGGGGEALRAGTSNISDAASSLTVAFSTAVADTAYRVAANFINTNDSDPIFLSGMVTSKTVNGFTMKFNAPTDSANYKLEYSIHEDV